MQPHGCILGPARQHLILQVVPDYSWVPLFLQIDSMGNQGIRKCFRKIVIRVLPVLVSCEGYWGENVLRPSGL